MTPRISPGPPADPVNRRRAREQHQLVKDELPRVRAVALAWRNGVGGLLAGLVGFGLIKGRTDIGELSSPWDAVVGVVLLAALLCGIAAALLLLRAAHGRPAGANVRTTATDQGLGLTALDHVETLEAASALRHGLGLSITCTALLAVAVGTTWYGPARSKLGIEVLRPSGPICGTVVRLSAGKLTLRTASGEVVVDLNAAEGIMAKESCGGGSPLR